jgi:hypothetical protein
MEIVLYQPHVGPKLANFWDIRGMKSMKPWGDANISSKDFGAPALKKKPNGCLIQGKSE